MKKILRTFLLFISIFLFTSCIEEIDYGSLTIEDINVEEDGEININPIFSIPERAEEIIYSFEGTNISISNGKVKGLKGETETTVTAKTTHHETTFKVSVYIDYGDLLIEDINLVVGQETMIYPVFSKEKYEEEITFEYGGNNIFIDGNLVRGLIPNTETVVTAKTIHHETKFKVFVSYVSTVLTDPEGLESKFAVPTPEEGNYVLLSNVDVETYRENGWTRLTAFAFNGSDNSWYNIEMNEALDVKLYARFNGVEKYNIDLFNANDEGIIIDGKIHYTIALLKNGQNTRLFVNDNLVCEFDEKDLEGYQELGDLEVTACANRANSGEYKVLLSNMYYELEGGNLYNKYNDYKMPEVLEYEDVIFNKEDGSEGKYSLGDISGYFDGCFVFTTTVTIDLLDSTGNMRPSAFAFNGSDNSWYNIELAPNGNATLYGRFNGVEKYHIHLFNINDDGIMVEGKVKYKVGLVKDGQATYFFINEKLVCSFSEQELNGYGSLSTFEFTSCSDVWRDGGPYIVKYSNISVSSFNTDVYLKYSGQIEEHKYLLEYGTLSFENINIAVDEEKTLNPVFSKPTMREDITYEYEGNNIVIENGIVKGLSEGVILVTAKTQHHETTFEVTVYIDYGTLIIDNIDVYVSEEKKINVIFPSDSYIEDITYEYEGNNIVINEGIVKGLVPNTITKVKAKSDNYEVDFEVSVICSNAVLESRDGSESKFVMPIPKDANYLIFADIDVELYRENGWTRLSAFAFNSSDNSWYNIEMNEAGDVYLYARFNGVEKYHIFLFNKNDDGITVNNKIHYKVALLKNGQDTKLFINDEVVCSFSESELSGYPPLSSLEVTACANRANSGEYKVLISNNYYVLEDSMIYYEYIESINYRNVILGSEDGAERKFTFGELGLYFGENYVFTATITIDLLDSTGNMRPSAFAFNGSDNSWYNIELAPNGNATLYGRFNGVEKYHIHLFNINDDGIMVEGKVKYKVGLVKDGQATYFFINEKLVCSFSEQELNGYGSLSTFEFTSCSDVWRDGGPYSVVYSEINISNHNTKIYEDYKGLV